jgi:1,4-alpha-glucan branching enzyme
LIEWIILRTLINAIELLPVMEFEGNESIILPSYGFRQVLEARVSLKK